jgi:hypothetical protein
VPVVFHGHTGYGDLFLRPKIKSNLDEMGNLQNNKVHVINEFKSYKIKCLDYNNLIGYDEDITEDTVPSLDQVLDLLKEELPPKKDFIINIEIKDSNPLICDLIFQ